MARCDQCEAAMINGVYCHETGCPNSHRDKTIECKECGREFVPESRLQQCCDEQCNAAYNGWIGEFDEADDNN